MSARLLHGTPLADDLLTAVAQRITEEQIDAGLAAVLVGDDPASHMYVRLKERAAKRVGIRFERHVLPMATTQAELTAHLEGLNARRDIHAILLQLPLPHGLNENAAIATMDPRKDVDGFHPDNLRAYQEGASPIEPVLTRAVMTLVAASEHVRAGQHAVVVANNPDVFAPPLLRAFADLGLTTDWMRFSDPDAAARLRDADVLIVALGKPHAITPDLIKPGAVLIDIGTTRVDGELQGDIDPAVDALAGARTPVPGGVGPLTVACLMEHVLTCWEQQTPSR